MLENHQSLSLSFLEKKKRGETSRSGQVTCFAGQKKKKKKNLKLK
jgi:hypothetical protein